MMSTNSRWRSDMFSGRALQQLDEALDRGQRAAQLVRGGRHELALGPLQPGALGDVAHGPDDAVGLAARAGRGDRQRPAVVLDHGLPDQAASSGGSGLSRSSTVVADRQLGHELGGARVDGGDRAEPGSVTISASPRLSIVTASRRRSSSIRCWAPARSSPMALNALAEVLQLARSGRLHAALELPGGQASGGLDELVERPPHRADQDGDQRQRADEREHAGDRHEQQRPARASGPCAARARLAGQLAHLELVGERTGPGKGARRRRRDREPALCRKLPGLRLGGDLSLREAHADGIVLRERR